MPLLGDQKVWVINLLELKPDWAHELLGD
jgi:hypothetical protein